MMSHDDQGVPWERYQAVAAELLNRFADRFGLDRVEGKQKIQGDNSTWEIDAKGLRDSDGAVIVVECRRKKHRLEQEALAAIAYRIQDIRAQGGIVVSPLPLQSGAKRIANAESIVEVQLDQNSTSLDFAMRFLGKLMVGASVQAGAVAGDRIAGEASRQCSCCGERFPLADNNQRYCRQCQPR
jgi:hypothetical protein